MRKINLEVSKCVFLASARPDHPLHATSVRHNVLHGRGFTVLTTENRLTLMGVSSARLAPLGMVSVLACAGCANIEMAHVNTTERVTQTDRSPEEKNEPGPKLADGVASPEVSVRQKCEVFAVDRVEVTKHKEAKNRSATLDWALGVSGLATAGIGTWIILDAANVHPDDPTSRTYNSLGPSGARTAGFVTLGLGLGLAAIAGVDVIRAQKSEAEVSTEARRRPDAVGTCDGKPVPNAKVEARFEQGTAKGRSVPLGETGSDGRLVVDVTRLEVPSQECGLEQQPFGSHVSLVAYGSVLGQADLQPAYTKWIADRRRADQDLEAAAGEEASACQSRGSCTNVKRFLGSTTCYGRSGERQRLTALIDDAAWSRAQSSTCASSANENACDGVREYARTMAEGRHAAEARQLLSAASFRSAKVECLRKDGQANCTPMIRWRDQQQTGSAPYDEANKVLLAGVPPIVSAVWTQTRASCQADPDECDVAPFIRLVQAAGPWIKDAPTRIAAAQQVSATARAAVVARNAPRPSLPACSTCEKNHSNGKAQCDEAYNKCSGSTCDDDFKKCQSEKQEAVSRCRKACR